jgi:hypothetical protein
VSSRSWLAAGGTALILLAVFGDSAGVFDSRHFGFVQLLTFGVGVACLLAALRGSLRGSATSELAPMLLPALLVCALITAYYWQPLTTSRTIEAIPEDGDVITQPRPIHRPVYQHIQDFGEAPLWNDRAGLGYPYPGGAVYRTAYPPFLLALKVAGSPGTAVDLLVWSHALLAALAIMALARLYGIRRWTSALAALLYVLSHSAVRWAPMQTHESFFIGLPLAVLGVELIWPWRDEKTASRPLIGVALLGLGLGLAGLGSHLQTSFFLLQVIGFFVLFRALTMPGPARARLRPLGYSALGAITGFVIAAPVFLPFQLLHRGTTRHSISAHEVLGMDRGTLASFVEPIGHIFQITGDGYLGLLAPALIAIGVIVALRSATLAVLPAFVAFGLLVGLKTPLLSLVLAVIPGWGFISTVEALAYVLVLPLALLAGVGADWLFAESRAKRIYPLAIALVIGSVAVWAFWIGRFNHPPAPDWLSTYRFRPDALPVWIAGAGAIVILTLLWFRKAHSASYVVVAATLLAVTFAGAYQERALGWKPVPDAPHPIFQGWLNRVSEANDANGRWMSYCQPYVYPSFTYRPMAFLDAQGRWLDKYDSFNDNRYQAYWNALANSKRYGKDYAFAQWNQHTPEDGLPSENLIDAAGISRVLGSRQCALHKRLGWTQLKPDQRYVVYSNPTAYPLAYVSHRWDSVQANPEEVISELSRAPRTHFGEHTDLVEGSVPSAGAGGRPTAAAIRRVSSEEVVVTARSGSSRPALLVLLDAYAPSWRAYDEGGRRLMIRPVNGAFRGVVLDGGQGRVTFRYEPWWREPLPIVSGLVATLLITFLVTRGIRALGSYDPRRDPDGAA